LEYKIYLRQLSAVLLAVTIGFAAGNSLAAEIKIGYVNVVKVIEQAPQGEAALKKLQAEFGPRDKKLVDMQQEIKKKEEDLDRNALVLKDSDKQAKASELIGLKRELRRATQDFRDDYNMRRNEELAALQKVVKQVIVEIAKQENYDLIVHDSTLYASGRVDITDKVLEKLKELNNKAAKK
jgi:outer membrane protein